MNINSTNQEKIKYAEYGTPQSIRTQMLKTIPPSFWKNSNKIFEPAIQGLLSYDNFSITNSLSFSFLSGCHYKASFL